MKIIDLLNERDSYVYDYIKNRRNDLTQQIFDLDEYVSFGERKVLTKQVQRAITTGDLSQWDEMDAETKFYTLKDLGLVPDISSSWEWKDATRLDKVLQTAIRKNQDERYQTELGPEKRAELNTKAEELAELKRQQRRKEALEDAELAFQRAETVAQRQAVMEKIKRQFQHDLDVINTNHRSNMEAIRTGNKHELDKMEKEHQHEKDMFDRQNPRKPGSSRIDVEIEPDLGPDDDDEKQSEFDQFTQDLNTIAAPQSLPGPDQKPPKKPSRYDNSDAVDVDFKEPSDEEDKKDKKDPPALPGPKKESISYYKNLIDQMEGRR